MGGQRSLLLCSAASLAFVVGALLLHAWFWVGIGAIVFAVSVFAQPWASALKPSTWKPTPVAKPQTIPSPPPIDVAVRIAPARPSLAMSPSETDVIPVAPESGLVIRTKRSTKRPTPAEEILDVALDGRRTVLERKPVLETHAIGFDNIDSNSGNFAFTPSPTVKDPVPPFELAVSRPVVGSLPPPVRERAAMSAHELAALTIEDIAERLGSPAINYAVASATLTLAGIDATREDGTRHTLAWDSITSVVARRLPPEAPFSGATFVDIVSTPGATLRVLPWTKLVGMPTAEIGEPRARELVKLIDAHCTDAQLDPATQLFATSSGHAAQLPTPQLLAVHDERFA